MKGESAVRLRTRPAGIATTFAYVPALDLPAVELPSDKVLIRGSVTELTLTALDGESIPGTYTAPAGAGPFPAVIVQHGLSSSHQAMYGLQEALTNLGFVTIAIDARGHGARGPADSLQQALTQGAPAAAMMKGTVIDLRQVVDFLSTRAEVDPQKIGFVGFSLGGILGAMLSGADERIATTVLVDAGADWQTLLSGTSIDWIAALRTSDPAFVTRAARALDSLDPQFWVSEISPRPLMLVRGKNDTVIPVESTDVLVAAAGKSATVFQYDGGHDLVGPSELTVRRTILNFVSKHLATGTPSGGGEAVTRP